MRSFYHVTQKRSSPVFVLVDKIVEVVEELLIVLCRKSDSNIVRIKVDRETILALQEVPRIQGILNIVKEIGEVITMSDVVYRPQEKRSILLLMVDGNEVRDILFDAREFYGESVVLVDHAAIVPKGYEMVKPLSA